MPWIRIFKFGGKGLPHCRVILTAPAAEDTRPELLEVDNTAVRERQVARLKTLRATRDQAKVDAALEALRRGAAGKENLLALSIEAMEARATVGEVSDALEAVFTSHRAAIRAISGVYGHAFAEDEAFRRIQAEIETFAKLEGRRPRMLVAKLGQDGHDRG